MYDVLKQRLSPEEASILVKAIQKTPHISGYSQQKWLRSEHVIVAKDERGNIMGACLEDDFGASWTEIAVIFVLPEHRGKGIGRQFFEMACADILERGRNIIIMSSEVGIRKVIEESDLDTFDSLEDLDEAYHPHYFTLTTYYTIRYHLSMYRNWERLRKRRVFEKKAPYLYGLKLSID